jgi:thymidylate kinase
MAASQCPGVARVVELVGVAGSGKTYAAEQLVSELRAHGHRAEHMMAGIGPEVASTVRLARKTALLLEELVRDPLAVAALIRAIRDSAQPSRRDAVAMLFTWAAMRGLVRRALRSGRLAVFDQCFLTGLWSAGLRGDPQPCRELLESQRWKWVLPDAVVRVRADHELVLAQIRTRGAPQSRLEALADNDLRPALRGADDQMTVVTGWWEQGTSRPLLTLANSGDGTTHQEIRRVAVALGDIRAEHERTAAFKGEQP